MTILQVLGVTAAYCVAGWLGLREQLVRGQVTPLWPPTGIAVAALLLLGVRVWPGITLGALLVNAPLGAPPLATLAIIVGNTLSPVCASLLLRRVGFRGTLVRLRDALALVFLGALAGMLISATVGTAALVLTGAVPESAFWETWSVWWAGDAMGVLVCAPALFALRWARPPRLAHAYGWVELAVLVAVAVILAFVATASVPNLLFLLFPCLIWSAFRFELAGAALCALVTCIVVVVRATFRVGLFAHFNLFKEMALLQAFNGSVALTALLLASVVAERNRAYEEIERVCARLSAGIGRGRTDGGNAEP
ncbi:MASE1 domain-containing protein [Streptomyces sp. NPDC004069]|uniref:MASE1 domain-containing protein n=1 Tax=Streptomyces sp. NPDC052043 TaxID=3365684 RepID=UPI0037D78184